jgi:hypothetical protein
MKFSRSIEFRSLDILLEDSFPHNREGNVMFLEFIFNQQQQFLTGIPRKKEGKLASGRSLSSHKRSYNAAQSLIAAFGLRRALSALALLQFSSQLGWVHQEELF